MRIKILIILFLIFTLALISSTRNTLEDVLPPKYMSVDKDQLYFTSGTSLSIFSLKKLKLNKSFGKKGEGPSEFLPVGDDLGMTVDVQTDHLIVTSLRKVSYFTKQGKFIKEIRAKNGFYHKPFGKYFLALRNAQIDKVGYQLVSIYDENFKIVKDIHKKKMWFQMGKGIDPTSVRPPLYYTHKGLVFTKNGNGNINVFNKKGVKVASTNANISKVKISSNDKKQYHEYYKTHPIYKNQYEQLKHLIKFPVYYSKIKHFDVADSRIYIFSHLRKKGKNELYIFDLKGKLIKKIFVKMPDLNPQDVFPVIKVSNSKIYQIVENEDDEEAIDLFVTEIKI